MLMIVAHHFVVNSGLFGPTNSPIANDPENAKSLFLLVFGMWGKTGINCFLMITGYFMCTSKITLRKFLKLMLWIYFYRIVIYVIFLCTGYEQASIICIVQILMPVWDFETNFTSCFIGFWLTIPFWNILIQNMTKRQHEILLILMLGMFTVLATVPKFRVSINYVTWFGIIYLIASYIRLYPRNIYKRTSLWGWMTLLIGLICIASVLICNHFKPEKCFYFVSDSNKILSVAFATVSFLWFNHLPIKYSKLINLIGASTFGVLLIHANSDAMRTWLWKDLLDNVGHYSLPLGNVVIFSFVSVLSVFFICNVIDVIRIYTLERPLFKWLDAKYFYRK